MQIMKEGKEIMDNLQKEDPKELMEALEKNFQINSENIKAFNKQRYDTAKALLSLVEDLCDTSRITSARAEMLTQILSAAHFKDVIDLSKVPYELHWYGI